MSYLTIAHESELDALIDDIMQAFPSNENVSQVEPYDDSVEGPFLHTKDISLSIHVVDQVQLDNDFYNTTYVGEQENAYDPSAEEAFNDFEESYIEAAEEEAYDTDEEEAYEVAEAHEAMCDDILSYLTEYAGFQLDSDEEEEHDVNPYEGDCNEESTYEPVLDLDNGSNCDTASQTECDAETEVEFELNDDGFNGVDYEGMENNFEDAE